MCGDEGGVLSESLDSLATSRRPRGGLLSEPLDSLATLTSRRLGGMLSESLDSLTACRRPGGGLCESCDSLATIRGPTQRK